ncbi:DUF3784 domain-containing protein [Pradoshia sp.]
MTVLFGFAFSLFFILTGIYIGRRGIVNFIAGYQEGSIEDEKGLAKRIGIGMIAFGIESFILVLLHLYLIPIEAYYIGVLAILNVVIILVLFIQARV